VIDRILAFFRYRVLRDQLRILNIGIMYNASDHGQGRECFLAGWNMFLTTNLILRRGKAMARHPAPTRAQQGC
jgi:hypothetical protein